MGHSSDAERDPAHIAVGSDASPAGRIGESDELSASEWQSLKSAWFELELADVDAQRRRLADDTLSARVRRELARMLAGADSGAHRFDAPAHLAMGFDAPRADAPVEPPPAPSLVGRRLGPFRVIRAVARGGMGAVYEAERDDAHYQQRVAIKSIWRGADSDVLLQRFRSERQILAGLQHPNIARLIDGGATEEHMPWLAMEFVEGVPIDEFCNTHRLGLSARLDLFRQVCLAVHHAHQHLVVHRDLKPSNVLVTPEGTVKLLDFGVAKLLDDSASDSTLTGAGLSPFTAAYAAPEQVSNGNVSTATDVYALGALLVVLLAGEPPLALAGLDPVARLLAVRDGTPRVPSAIARAGTDEVARLRGFENASRLASALSGELDAIAQYALRREPGRRYGSAMALGDDVRRYLRRDRVLARPDTFGYRTWAFTRRHRALVGGVAMAVVVIVLAAVVSLVQARSVRLEAARAERAAAFMAGMMSGPSVGSRDPTIRIGAIGTMAELLDSAMVRVPREFAQDARIRARLYAAFASNYATQLRYRAARNALDSARALGAEAYGVRSTEYGDASLELASLELVYNGPDAAEEPLSAAEAAAEARSAPTIRARAMVLRARQAISRGQVRRADSLAALVLSPAMAAEVTPAIRLSAEGVRLHASSWLRRDPRDYLRRARHVMALTDSLGVQLSQERITADGAELDALLTLGRGDVMQQRVREDRERLRAVLGVQPMLDVEAARLDALLAHVLGDTTARRVALAQGWSILSRTEHFPASTRLLYSSAYVDDALSRADADEALRASQYTLDMLQPTRAAMLLVFAQLSVANARLARKDPAGAELALRDGLAQLATAPDLSSMLPRLRRALVESLAAQGRTREADSVRALDPPKANIPPCTPGGQWIGCPDG